MDVSKWNWGMIGVIFGGVVILLAFYQIVESSEAELRSEMQRMEAELKAELQRIEAQRQADNAALRAEFKAELAALSDKMDRFIERVDSRLDEVERNQARLEAVNELLAQQIAER